MNKKILYLHPHFVLPGGAGRFALETANEFSRRGWEVHIASIKASDAFVKSSPHITFHNLGGPLSNSIFYWLCLPYLLIKVLLLTKRLKPNVVFSQVFPANWWGFFVKAFLGKSVFHVWMCQEPSAFIHSQRWIQALPFSIAGLGARFLNPILKIIDVFLSGFIDRVFANSKFSRNLAIDAYGYKESEVGICYPGVDLIRFSPNEEILKKKYQCITCARLTKFKNIDKIIEGIAAFNRDDVTLVIIGNGEEYENLQHLCEKLQMTNRVTFRKTVSDVEMVQALQESFVLIHAAQEEPFGLAPVEAMACGTPVIAMKDGGPSETVDNLHTGFLCEDASVSELKKALMWAIEQADIKKINEACVARAELFTWQNAVDTLEAVFPNNEAP